MKHWKIWTPLSLALCLATWLTVVVFFVPPPKPALAQLNSAQTWGGTATGTSSALQLTIHNVIQLNDLLGVPVRFISSGTNPAGTPATLVINIDTGGSLPSTAIVRPTSNLGIQAVGGGELQNGQMAEVTYDGVNGFVITSPIDMTPVGHSIDLRQSSGTAPAGYLIEDGSCYTRTLYPSLFAVIGTTYNAGAPSACSGTQFAVPFSNGTAFVANDNQGANTANRITNAATGCAATAAGVLCGNQVVNLTQPNLPNVVLSASVTGPSSGNGVLTGSTLVGVNSGGAGAQASNGTAITTINSTGATSSLNGGVSQTSINKLPPLLTGFRAIKI